jgi:hypothetical protein
MHLGATVIKRRPIAKIQNNKNVMSVVERKIIMIPEENELFDENTEKSDENNDIKGSNAIKDPDEWTTGGEPMTGAQQSYLKTLSDEAGEEFDENLSKSDASKRIDELQHKTGRGLNNAE